MKPYLRVTFVYAVFGILWIFFSDRLVGMLTDNMEGLTFLQTMKGWLFIGLSSLLLLVLSKQAYDAQRRVEAEKLVVFNKTVEGSCHILLNYLNQMQLVTIEAEHCAAYDKSILRLANEATAQATEELKKLGELRIITAEHIDAVIYEKTRRRAGPAEWGADSGGNITGPQ